MKKNKIYERKINNNINVRDMQLKPFKHWTLVKLNLLWPYYLLKPYSTISVGMSFRDGVKDIFVIITCS